MVRTLIRRLPELVFAAIAIALLTDPFSIATDEVQFVDATQSSGLHFLYRNFVISYKYLIETMTGGVAVFDFD